MVFGIICVILVAAVAYMHWAQGFFSGVVSMTFAVLASSLAIGMHESIIASILGGKLADMSNGMVICLIFVAVYGIGRIAFDSLIPGNVRLPLYVDKVGGLVCGFVAGIFAVGTVAVAVQTFPFGPIVATFSRYPLAGEDRNVTVPGRGSREVDAEVRDTLVMDAGQSMPAEDKRLSLFGIAVDQIVLNYAAQQSASGAFATSGTPFATVHPDFLQEVFFQRLGVEPSAKHTAMNLSGKTEVSVPTLFAPPTLKSNDSEMDSIRGAQGGSFKPGVITPGAAGDPFVVRMTVKLDASEKDSKLRFSTGQARLVIGGKNYYPIGTLHTTGDLVMMNRVDDFMIAEPFGPSPNEITVDFVYLLPPDAFIGGATAAPTPAGTRAAATATPTPAAGRTLQPGTFFEFKRFGRVDLAGAEIRNTPVPHTGDSKPDTPGGVLRKQSVLTKLFPVTPA